MALLNRAKQLTATIGTGTIVLGPVVVPYQSFGVAGAVDTATYSLLIEQGNDWELSTGVYSASAQTLTRNLVTSSTGSLLNLNGSAVVSCAAMARDYHPYEAWSSSKPPQLADFTVIAATNGASITNAPNGLLMCSGTANNFSGCNIFKPAPAGQSFSLYCRVKCLFTMHQFMTFGLVFLNNNTGRTVQVDWSMRLNDSSSQWQQSILVENFNSLSSFNSGVMNQTVTDAPLWLRMDLVNNNTINCYMSPDGYSWILLASPTLASWLAAVTHIGCAIQGLSVLPDQWAVVSAFSTVAPN